MACPGVPCSTPVPAPGAWVFQPNPSAPVFSDPAFLGIAPSDASCGTHLLVVDPLTGQVTRPTGPKGVWQHDDARCLPDFFGPLDDPQFVPGTVDPKQSQSLAGFQSPCGDGPAGGLVRLTPTEGFTGAPMLLADGQCEGSVSPTKLSPGFLLNGRQTPAGACVSPKLLGYVPRTVTLNGRTVTQLDWYGMDRIQQAVVRPVVDADTFEVEAPATPTLQLAVWREETCTAGGKVQELVGMNLEQTRRALGMTRIIDVNPPVKIYSQLRSSIDYTNVTAYPAIGDTIPPPDVTETYLFDLTTVPEYTAEATHVILQTSLFGASANTGGASLNPLIVINGRERSRIHLNGGSEGSDSNQFMIPIPVDKKITVFYNRNLHAAGDVDAMFVLVFLEGFVVT